MPTSLRQTLRRLAGSPAFTLTVIATLALGISATVAVFSVISGVLLKPLPFEDPDRLVGVWHTAPGLGFDQINQCAGLDIVYRDESTTFESTGMWTRRRSAVTGTGEPEEVESIGLTATVLPLLGVDAIAGRRFEKEDDTPDAPLTVMLSDAYWQRRYGGSEGTMGQQLQLNGRSRVIIGVLPPTFSFLGAGADLYYPIQYNESEAVVGQFNFQGIGRLRPGVTLEQANADMDRLLLVALERFPGGLNRKMMEEAGFAAALVPLHEQVVGAISQTLWILLASVGLVLLVACANVANLYLVRAEGRSRELALRTALGAGRARLARGLLAESSLLALFGGGLGLLLAWGLVRLLIWIGPDSVPRLQEVGVDSGVALFAIVVSLLSGLLFGLVPALRHARSGSSTLSDSLKEGGRTGSAGRERFRMRSALVVTQVALGLVLLVGSGLMLRSFIALRGVEPGFTDADELLTFRVAVPSAEVEDPNEAALLHERIQQRLAALPGVESVGATSSVTMDPWNSNDALMVEDFPVEDGSLPPIRRYKFVTPGYFETMGNAVVAGRSLEWADLRERRPVAVITANLARELWGEPLAALGKRIADGVPALEDQPPLWREIVGVVGDIHDDGVDKEVVETVFWPAVMPRFWGEEPWVQRSLGYVVRSGRTGSDSLLREAQQAVWSENANLPLAQPQTVADILQRSLARASFTMLMLALAAVVALVIASVGIYGVISYIVSQRTREIGVRLALGAKASDVRSMMVRYGMGLATAGVVLGLVTSGLLSGTLSRLLFGVEPRDPATFVGVAVLLALVALLASAAAGRRAARVDAITALRAE